MAELHSSLYAAALLACLALIPLARANLARVNRAFWLTAFLVLQSTGFLAEWLMLNPATPAKALWLGSLMVLAFLLAPCLWLCARELTEDVAPRLRDLPRGHGFVIAAGILLVLPLIASTHGGTDFAPDQEHVSWHSSLIHEGMLAAIALFGLQAAFYLRECIRLLVRHTRESKALFSNIDDQSLNTLRALILILAMHWLVGMARGVYGFVWGKDAGPSLMFALCEVAVLAWAVFTLPRSRPAVDAEERQLAADTSAEKYSRSALDHAARTRIRRKLDEGFEQRAVHRDGRLSLRSLCAELRENAHYVSQVINQDLQVSFFDLVNRHRVREAMCLLTQQPDRPVLEIALAVGFNSKSTFNAAFRQHAGLTPTAFRAENTSQPSGSDA